MRAAPGITVVDCETTGLDCASDRVIEVAALKLDSDLRIIERFVSLVNPSCPLPLHCERLTGIGSAELAAAPPPAEVWPRLAAFVAGDVVAGHNVRFDVGFVLAECRRARTTEPACAAFDTLEAALLLFPELDGHALDRLAAALGLPAPGHRAEADAEATAVLLAALCRRARELPQRERRLLESAGWEPLRLLDRFASAAAVSTWRDPAGAEEDRRQRRGDPARRPSGPAGGGGAGGANGAGGTVSVGGAATGDGEPARPGAGDEESCDPASPARLAVDDRAWHAAFAPDGGVAAALPGYRLRPGQVELAEAVAAVLAGGGIGVFEAGTGMGKSLAYLLPAAFRSAATGTRVVISTKTKALQRQLAAGELPLVARLLPGWRWAVLMGRENYLCERSLRDACSDPSADSDADRLLALAYLSGRSRRTEVDLSGLPYGATRALPKLTETAAALRSSTARCARRACRVRAQCRWRRARERASAAHLVCVNHALLLTGVGVPCHEDVVIDEAHLLPDEAQAAFSKTVDRALLAELQRELAPRRARSLAAQLREAAGDAPPEDRADVLAAADQIGDIGEDLPLREAELAGALELLGRDDDAPDDGYDHALWLRSGLRDTPAWDVFADACHGLAGALSGAAVAAAAAAALLPEDSYIAGAARALADRAGEAAEALEAVIEPESSHRVVWGSIGAPPAGARAGAGARGTVAADGRAVTAQTELTVDRSLEARSDAPAEAATRASFRLPFWSLTVAPLSPAPGIRTALWERLRGAVLVSATLAVRESFEYFDRQTGLSADLGPRHQIFASPFDYRRQAVLVVEHAPERAYSASDAVVRQTERLRALTETTGGRLLALFTNKRQMNQVAAGVGHVAEAGGVLLLAQGVHGSAASLADEFRSHSSTVLLGVDALWTGQDFPGDTLVCLVIAKLPFPRQDPLFQARREAAVQDGLDWFRGFYLPEAVLRFRQGFGRLIRTEDDRGVVVVLDHRLTQKSYADDFFGSLPEIKVVRARPEAVAEAAAAALRRLGCLD